MAALAATSTAASSGSQPKPPALPGDGLLRSLFNGTVVGIGEHRVTWDGVGENGQPVASGTYFYRLRIGDLEREKKLHVLR